MRKVRLSWEDQVKMRESKAEDIFKLYQKEQHQSLEVKIQKKSTADNSNNVDNYDLYLIEKSLYNLKREIERRTPKTLNINDESKKELEFHEQYFS